MIKAKRSFISGCQCVFLVLLFCGAAAGETVRLDTETVRDKIKGGWVGQTVGVTYGLPTEFRWLGTMIPD
ncbi:MAG: ADP-ribosylglycohydrolase family protein, partial [Gemmatimonadota bacterium]|nr:ADP-ribosylglycohydrolase family protein [Gemmatimonadota bacterium]